MKNAGIARRVTLVLVASVAITVGAILGLGYLLRASSISARNLAALTRNNSQASFQLLDVVVRVQGLTLKLVKERDPDAMEALINQRQALVKDGEAKIDQMVSGGSDIKAAFRVLVQANDDVTNLLLQTRDVEAHQLFIEKSNPAFESVLAAMNRQQSQVLQSADAESTRLNAQTAQLSITILILVGAGVVVLAIYGGMMVRGISAALNRAIQAVKDVAEGEGDLTKRLEINSHDELGELAKWFNIFLDKLHKIIAQVAVTAEQVASASEEISAAAMQQSQSADAQNGQTSQVATTIHEMSSTVMQISDNSNQAAEASRKAAETARAGGAIIEETLAKMRSMSASVGATAKKVEELGKSSDQIGRIIGVIDEIADQTNLLALNAAIEAARAGEQGRGFAVVADEVRKLAERTTKATNEIANMIQSVQVETKTAVSAMEEGTKQVEQGVSFTARAGESLQQIIRMSDTVGEMITQIATAAMEQSSATEEINHSMTAIATLVRESTSGVQQSAQACQGLSGLAFDLQKMVSSFKVSAADDHSSSRNYHGGDREQYVPAGALPADRMFGSYAKPM